MNQRENLDMRVPDTGIRRKSEGAIFEENFPELMKGSSIRLRKHN